MTKGHNMGLIYYIVIIGTFTITVGGLVWKTAQLAQKIEINEKTTKAAHTRIDKFHEDKTNEMNEVRQQILTIIQSQARIEERILFVIEEIKCIKGKVHDRGTK